MKSQAIAVSPHALDPRSLRHNTTGDDGHISVVLSGLLITLLFLAMTVDIWCVTWSASLSTARGGGDNLVLLS